MEAPRWDEELLDDLAQVMADVHLRPGPGGAQPIRCIHTSIFRTRWAKGPGRVICPTAQQPVGRQLPQGGQP